MYISGCEVFNRAQQKSRRVCWPTVSVLIWALWIPTAVRAQPGLEYSGATTWDSEHGRVEFVTSGSMPGTREGFFWEVPQEVKQIQIAANVTCTGGFRILYRNDDNPLRIKGADRGNSRILGTQEQAWTLNNDIAENDKWKYSSISVVEDAIVHIEDLTLINPRGYIVSGYANKAVIHLDSCNLLDTRAGDNNNSDGFAGAAGSSIKNTLISTADDGIKIYHDIEIENVIIEHHRNGAPLQFGWGGGSQLATAQIKNLTIKGVDPKHRYNMAPLTWEKGHQSTRQVTVEGLTVDTRGEIYVEEDMTWRPLGLLELKPKDCIFNLNITHANLNGLPLGIVRTPGVLEIE